MSRIWIATLAALAVSACSNSPTAPAPPPVAACVTANTAEITLRNISTLVTLNVQIDNQTRGILTPGQATPYTITAGQTHTVRAIITNTTIVGCTTTTSFFQCETRTLTCGG